MNPNVLAGLLKRVYNDFNMLTFDNRLKVQKFVYLLQEHGLNLGYRFSLYLRGPYCTEVAKDGFQIENYRSVPPLGFASNDAEIKFKEFLSFYSTHKNNAEWLEIAASILIFRRLYQSSTKSDIVGMVINKSPFFSPNREGVLAVWEELKGGGFINGS